MNSFLSFVLLAALGYGAFAGFIYLMQPRLLYYSDHFVSSEPIIIPPILPE